MATRTRDDAAECGGLSAEGTPRSGSGVDSAGIEAIRRGDCFDPAAATARAGGAKPSARQAMLKDSEGAAPDGGWRRRASARRAGEGRLGGGGGGRRLGGMRRQIGASDLRRFAAPKS